MELMDSSFDQLYKCVYAVPNETMPEDILGKTSLAVSIFWYIKLQCKQDIICLPLFNAVC